MNLFKIVTLGMFITGCLMTVSSVSAPVIKLTGRRPASSNPKDSATSPEKIHGKVVYLLPCTMGPSNEGQRHIIGIEDSNKKAKYFLVPPTVFAHLQIDSIVDLDSIAKMAEPADSIKIDQMVLSERAGRTTLYFSR